MAKQRRRKRYTRNEKVFYFLSLLIIFSMVLASVYIILVPEAAGTGIGF